MKENEAPKKLFIKIVSPISDEYTKTIAFEYTRTDAFIKKALKWYCLNCECNDNCKDIKCSFYRGYEHYLKGTTNAIPPKFSGRILNEDGSTSEDWHYRHFINRMQNAFIEKACEYIKQHWIWNTKIIEDFRKYMEE